MAAPLYTPWEDELPGVCLTVTVLRHVPLRSWRRDGPHWVSFWLLPAFDRRRCRVEEHSSQKFFSSRPSFSSRRRGSCAWTCPSTEPSTTSTSTSPPQVHCRVQWPCASPCKFLRSCTLSAPTYTRAGRISTVAIWTQHILHSFTALAGQARRLPSSTAPTDGSPPPQSFRALRAAIHGIAQILNILCHWIDRMGIGEDLHVHSGG